MKFFRKIIFQFKTAFTNIKRHFSLTLSAILSVCIALIFVAIFAILSSNLNYMSHNIESEMSIRVSLDHTIKDDSLIQLQKAIASLNGVVEVEYRSKDDELNAYKEEYQANEKLFSMYEGESNPITDALIIKVDDVSKVSEVSDAIASIDGVLKVSDGGTMTQKLVRFFNMIRYGGGAVVVVLLLVAVFLIANKIKMSIYTRRDELAIMRFVGAGNWFIRFPMMLEGLFIGLLGGILSAILALLAYFLIYRDLNGILMSEMLVLLPTTSIAGSIALMLMICGLVVGLIGSYFSTSRYLRWKR